MNSSGKFALVMACNLLCLCSFAQTQDSIPKKQTKIFLEYADSVTFDQKLTPDYRILRGDVVFRHDSSYMYCDSAYFYEKNNSLEAFSNVRMEQGDTLFIYGNWLFYDGNTQLARLRENVRMENNQVTLFTDSLNYDRAANIGYYFDGGLIVDEENELSSLYGQYEPNTKLAVFNDSVRLENPQFILYSDTLHYHSDTKIANILGPSIIVSDSGTVYTSRGWYNTETNMSLLLDQSQVVSGNRILIGDSIVYDKENGFSEVFGNMSLRDTTQRVTLEGQYGYFNERTEFAFATDSARFLEYSQGDTLYLHADTLLMTTLDSSYREINAYYGVRFFRQDLQGVCDSMQFNTRDSILYMYHDPIIWNEGSQIYGDTIVIFMNDSTIDHAHVRQFAFAIQQIDSFSFNQMRGNDLKAYFEGKQVSRIDVSGNAESLYYSAESDGTMIGVNTTKSAYINIWLKDNEIQKIKLFSKSEGLMTPMQQLTPEQKTLKDFHWYDYIRPKDKDDIYHVVKRKTGDAPKRSNKFVF